MPAREELPSTLRRSSPQAQETWSKTHDSAVEQYGEGSRSHRTAYAALKHSFEKVGDRWEPKRRKGPSDRQAARGRSAQPADTATGVNANATKDHLLQVARKLDVPGRSSMSKPELVSAIEKANQVATSKARGRPRGATGRR